MKLAKHGLLLVSLGLVAACRDPALDDKINNLGKETSGIPVGEYHRAGQACAACHVDGGPAGSKPFTVAGTVFAGTNRLVGVASVTIALRDSENTTPPNEVKTNCVGNFFIRPQDWQPKFPITVAISKGVARKMNTVIGRAASCGSESSSRSSSLNTEKWLSFANICCEQNEAKISLTLARLLVTL